MAIKKTSHTITMVKVNMMISFIISSCVHKQARYLLSNKLIKCKNFPSQN